MGKKEPSYPWPEEIKQNQIFWTGFFLYILKTCKYIFASSGFIDQYFYLSF